MNRRQNAWMIIFTLIFLVLVSTYIFGIVSELAMVHGVKAYRLSRLSIVTPSSYMKGQPTHLNNDIFKQLVLTATNKTITNSQKLYSSSLKPAQNNLGLAVAELRVDTSPTDVSINPNTNTIYVPNWGSDNVSVIDGKSNSVIKNITVGSLPAKIS